MTEIEYREYREEDAESFLRLHDSVFPAMSMEFWRNFSHSSVTAAVAIMGGEVVGTVPFQLRDIRVRPGVTVRMAWEFSVCVRQELRGTGVGSRCMACAKEFLRDRCVAMAVYRNDEFSLAYRYYARNGHHDLAYMRSWRHDGGPGRGEGHVEQRRWEDLLAAEDAYLEVFADAYGACGGFPERRPGFYAPAVNTSEYAEVPVALTVLTYRDEEGALSGYAIVGEERLNPTLHLMEMAARGNDPAIGETLVEAFMDFAGARGLPAVASVTDSFPYLAALQALGFRPALRSQASMVIMLHVLDAESLADAVWREDEASAGLEVAGWTPEREVSLHRARGRQRQRVVLEMKEDMLARLLLGRLDLQGALAQQTVTALGGTRADLAAISHALPYVPWTYHYLDFV